jgi:hypothetical protein
MDLGVTLKNPLIIYRSTLFWKHGGEITGYEHKN